MENKIITKEDIVRELSEEMGKDYQLILDIVNTNLERVDDLVNKDRDMLTIGFPRLGTFKANRTYLREVLRSKEMADKTGIIQHRENIIKSGLGQGIFKSKSMLRNIVRNYGFTKVYKNRLVLKMQEIYKLLSKESEKLNEEIYN